MGQPQVRPPLQRQKQCETVPVLPTRPHQRRYTGSLSDSNSSSGGDKSNSGVESSTGSATTGSSNIGAAKAGRLSRFEIASDSSSARISSSLNEAAGISKSSDSGTSGTLGSTGAGGAAFADFDFWFGWRCCFGSGRGHRWRHGNRFRNRRGSLRRCSDRCGYRRLGDRRRNVFRRCRRCGLRRDRRYRLWWWRWNRLWCSHWHALRTMGGAVGTAGAAFGAIGTAFGATGARATGAIGTCRRRFFGRNWRWRLQQPAAPVLLPREDLVSQA